MARKTQTPEDFVRDYLKRGTPYEQILHKASKKDPSFYHHVAEIIKHTTLIEKMEKQLDTDNQSQINFDANTESELLVLGEPTPKRKTATPSRKDDGRSDLTIDPDEALNDLEAPILGPFRIKVDSFTPAAEKRTIKVPPNQKNHVSIFDPVDDTEMEKLKIFPPIHQISNTEKELTVAPNQEQEFIATPVTESKAAEYEDYDKKELINLSEQKDLLIQEINRNKSQREQEYFHAKKQLIEREKQLLGENQKLKKVNSSQRMIVYTALGISAVLFLLTTPFLFTSNEIPSSTTQQPIIVQNEEVKAEEPHEILAATTTQEDTNMITNGTFIVDENPEATSTQIAVHAETRPAIVTEEAPIVEEHAAPNKYQLHTVKKGESLWKITAKYYGKDKAYLYKKVMEANGLKKETAPTGKVIKIPDLAELD